MAKRPFPDPTKADFAAITMCYKDYFFLKKWYDYYAEQFGPQHLYIISHGNDPEHRRIAPEANIIGVFRDETMTQFNRRRWRALTALVNGFLFYYNWVICGDTDEIVIVDPDVAPNLAAYLSAKSGDSVPKSMCPLGLELIHNPKIETGLISDEIPVLSNRSVFRLNANYSKPCVVRSTCTFTMGGHANSHLPRVLDDHLYLVHLRYFDYETSRQRLIARKEMRSKITDQDVKQSQNTWVKDLENFERLSSGEASEKTIDFPDFRKKMVENQKLLHNDKIAFFGGGRSKTLYALPDRFRSIF
ncbi:glycosyltransferase family 2 protein [Pseudaestuariivita rosea]|uniref:glycosyltransferase family 2 protein n=1 Tax=Pseudaestuariivita rosea TaxID=2763263 RepID=UPI001ABA1C15|nr:glycosyltransferase family 2 protein [Pseudaestuariivita rosea]